MAYNVRQRGSNITVTVTIDSTEQFAKHWPCFGEPSELYFEFDRHGDLIDVVGDNDTQCPAGISALASDAQNRAADALGLPDYFRR